MKDEILIIVVILLLVFVIILTPKTKSKEVNNGDSYKIICIDEMNDKYLYVQYTKNGETQSCYCTHTRQILSLYDELEALGTLDMNGYELKEIEDVD